MESFYGHLCTIHDFILLRHHTISHWAQSTIIQQQTHHPMINPVPLTLSLMQHRLYCMVFPVLGQRNLSGRGNHRKPKVHQLWKMQSWTFGARKQMSTPLQLSASHTPSSFSLLQATPGPLGTTGQTGYEMKTHRSTLNLHMMLLWE